MTATLSTLRRGLALSVGLLLGAACSASNADAPPASGDLDQPVARYGAWNGGLADTTPAAPVTLPQTVLTAGNGNNWICQNTQYDEKRNLEQLLSPGTTAGVFWPGALIQGQSLIAGVPAEIPLPRSPIAISIDLAVDTPSLRIEDPTSATVQTAIANLQRQADVRLGPIDVVPARLDFHQTEAFSANQTKVDVGLYANFPLEGADVSASVGVNVDHSFQRHTIAVTLIQPMYTVSFADEEKSDPNAYLASSVTPAQVQDMVNRGIISSTNLPTYVKSVTYGRMLVFTITNTNTANAVDVEVAVQATVDQYGGGGNVSTQVKNLLDSSEVHVQAFGGSQDSALAAIRSGDLGKFFTAVPATQAVPLSYRVNYLKDGSVALLGAETKFTKSECSNAGTSTRYWHIQLDSVTSNGGCPFNYTDSAFVFAGATPPSFRTGIEYILLAHPSAPINDTMVNKGIVIPLGSTTGLAVWSAFIDSSCPAGGCYQTRVFSGGDTLAANPYMFTHFISMPGNEAGCVATFFWEIFTEPVLAPPRGPPGT